MKVIACSSMGLLVATALGVLLTGATLCGPSTYTAISATRYDTLAGNTNDARVLPRTHRLAQATVPYGIAILCPATGC